MTFGEAIDLALRDLGLGVTEYSREQYGELFLQYANAAVLELSKDDRPVAKDETVAVTDGIFLFSSLAHPIYKLLYVRAGDRVYHTTGEGDVCYVCQGYTGDASVTYEYFFTPALQPDEDIPLPSQYHQLVPLFIAAQFQLGGDKEQQLRGNNNISLFQSMRSNLRREQHGATDSYRLKNRGW